MMPVKHWLRWLGSKCLPQHREDHPYRTARFEPLERRLLLSASPGCLGELEVECALLPYQAELSVPQVPGGRPERELTIEASDATPIKISETTLSSDTITVPAYASDSKAAHTLFLDFDGHNQGTWGTHEDISIPAFLGSATDIQTIWNVVADDFAPFDINVTTIEPAASAFANGAGWHAVIGGNGASHGYDTHTLGVAYINDFMYGPDPNTVFIFSDNFSYAVEIGNTLSHEVGHTLGLEHYWLDRDNDNQLDYGENTNPGAIMATPDQGLNRESWSVGYASENTEMTRDQDDAALIASRLGWHADNQGGNDRGAATAVAVTAEGHFVFAGTIERQTDADYVYIDVLGAGLGSFHIDIDPLADNLDVALALYDAPAGLALASAAPSDSYSAALETTLAPGRYYIGVTSDGEPGEIGRYTLTGTLPVDAPPQALGLEVSEDTGSSSTDRLTRDTTPTLTVHFSEPVFGSEQDVTLLDPQDRVVPLSNVTGWGSTSITFGPAQALVLDGTYRVILQQGIHDSGGLQLSSGTGSALTFVLDTAPPAVSITPAKTSDTTPPITGAVNDPDATVLVIVNGQSYNAANQGNGTWALPNNTITPSLAAGTYNVNARATDRAGNTAWSDGTDALTITSPWSNLFGSFWDSPTGSSTTFPSLTFNSPSSFSFTLPSLGSGKSLRWPF